MFYSDLTTQFIAKSSFKLYSNLAKNGQFSKFSLEKDLFRAKSSDFMIDFKEYNRCGRVLLANSLPNKIQLKRIKTRFDAVGAHCKMLDNREEMFKRWPMLAGDDLKVKNFFINKIF